MARLVLVPQNVSILDVNICFWTYNRWYLNSFHFSTSSNLSPSVDAMNAVEVSEGSQSNDQQEPDSLLNTTFSELGQSSSQPVSVCSSQSSVGLQSSASACPSASKPKKRKKDTSSFEEEFLERLDSKEDRFDRFGDEVAESMRELPAGYVQDRAISEIRDFIQSQVCWSIHSRLLSATLKPLIFDSRIFSSLHSHYLLQNFTQYFSTVFLHGQSGKTVLSYNIIIRLLIIQHTDNVSSTSNTSMWIDQLLCKWSPAEQTRNICEILTTLYLTTRDRYAEPATPNYLHYWGSRWIALALQ